MDTVWFGIKLGLGLALGFGVMFVGYREIRGFLYAHQFVKVGCTYQSGDKPGTPSGWLTRDPRTDDWLLWDELHNVCWRMADFEACLQWDEKGWRIWAESRGIPYVPPLGEAVEKDSSQWNLSNYSLKQFLSLAREYHNFWKDRREPE